MRLVSDSPVTRPAEMNERVLAVAMLGYLVLAPAFIFYGVFANQLWALLTPFVAPAVVLFAALVWSLARLAFTGDTR